MNESHASVRARERYAVNLSPHDLAVMLASIEGGKAVLMSAPPGTTRARYIVRHGPATMQVIYDTVSRFIVTVLPADAKLGKMG